MAFSGGSVTAKVALAGEEALARLRHPPFSCPASFTRSFYLENARGKLVCAGGAALEAGPLNLLCAPWPCESALPAPGGTIRREGSRLVWPGGALDLADAAVWQPPEAAGAEARAGAEGGTGDPLPKNEFLARIDAFGPATECAPLFSHLLGGVPLPENASPFLRAGRDAAAALHAWLHARPSGTVPGGPPPVRGLLGLGPGLTPSGDDILGGMMMALYRSARRPSQRPPCAPPCAYDRRDAAAALYAAVLELPGHTNAISMAHLEMAAQGLGADALHRFIASLYERRLDIRVLARLGRIGHSSGWDMALGAALAVYPPFPALS